MEERNIIIKPIKRSGSRDNAVATILKVLTGIIWLSGFIAGIIGGGNYGILSSFASSGSFFAQLLLRFGYASSDFTLSSAIIIWSAEFLVGLLPLVAAEIISILNEIKTTSYVISDMKELSTSTVRADEEAFNEYMDENVTNNRVLGTEIEVEQYDGDTPFIIRKIRVTPHDESTAGFKLVISDNSDACESIRADIIFTSVFDERYMVHDVLFEGFHRVRSSIESDETICDIPVEVYNYIKTASVKVLSDNADADNCVSETKQTSEKKVPERLCPNCGALITDDDAVFCAVCGTRI